MSDNASEIIPNLVVGHKQDGRARYSKQAKLTLVEACLKPGVSVSRMALVNGLNANLLRKWITQYQDLVDTPITAAPPTQSVAVTLVPVTQLNEAEQIESRETGRDQGSTVAQSSIEIVLGDAVIKLQGDVDSRRLRTVLDCLAVRSMRDRRSS